MDIYTMKYNQNGFWDIWQCVNGDYLAKLIFQGRLEECDEFCKTLVSPKRIRVVIEFKNVRWEDLRFPPLANE